MGVVSVDDLEAVILVAVTPYGQLHQLCKFRSERLVSALNICFARKFEHT